MRASHYLLAIAVSIAGATGAHAQTYRWVDENGVVQYSQELPPPTANIQELAVVEGTATLSPFEQRALEIINEERRALAQERATAASQATQPLVHGNPGASSDPGSAAASRARAIAARDPCLLSPDPRCAEKNAHNYDPYHGYLPAQATASAELTAARAPVGASGSGSMGGEVSGRIGVPVRATAGNSPQPVTTSR